MLCPAVTLNQVSCSLSTIVYLNGTTDYVSCAVDIGAGVGSPNVSNTISEFSGSLVSYTMGTSQTWQNVAASRAVGVDYTNSTGSPIDISVSLNNDTSGTLMWIAINGVQTINSLSQPSSGNRLAIYGRIPVGATYRIATSGGTNSSITWSELR